MDIVAYKVESPECWCIISEARRKRPSKWQINQMNDDAGWMSNWELTFSDRSGRLYRLHHIRRIGTKWLDLIKFLRGSRMRQMENKNETKQNEETVRKRTSTCRTYTSLSAVAQEDYWLREHVAYSTYEQLIDCGWAQVHGKWNGIDARTENTYRR